MSSPGRGERGLGAREHVTCGEIRGLAFGSPYRDVKPHLLQA